MASLRSRPKRNNLDFTSSPSSEKSLEYLHWPQLQVFNIPFLAVLTAGLLFITIFVGTCCSYLLYSTNCPALPIYQLVSHDNSYPPACGLTLPYFARKSNFINQNFVKLGWAWTSLAVWANVIFFSTYHTINYPNPTKECKNQSDGPQHSTTIHHIRVKSNYLGQSTALYFTATALWIFFTQWFFGSSLLDRVLKLTGAKCIVSVVNQQDGPEKLKIITSRLSNTHCEPAWGQHSPGLNHSIMAIHRPYWSGGMDISGHVFLLSLSILLILSTLAPSIQLLWFSKPVLTVHRIGIYASLTLVGIWWWMLLMTSLYFHEPAEKFAGLVIGVGSWWISERAAEKLMG